MFIISVKSHILKKTVSFALVAVFLVIGGTIAVSKNRTATVGNFKDISLNGETAADRKAFFSQFGWTVSEDPIEVKETVIPSEFDESYLKYNELQKEQNFDLEKYKGVRVKSWSYEITNYPGYENTDSVIRGNLITLNGKIIGGDICSVELGGFMHGFSSEINSESTQESSSLPQEE